MDNLISEIYDKVIEQSNFMNEIDLNIEKQIEDVLRNDKAEMGWKEYEDVRDKYVLTASNAKKGGFIKGFQYAVMLLTESHCDKNLFKSFNDF